MKHIQLYENFGIIVEPYVVPTQIECTKCGWNWNFSDGKEKDMYVCPECGTDNRIQYLGEPDDDDPSGPEEGRIKALPK